MKSVASISIFAAAVLAAPPRRLGSTLSDRIAKRRGLSHEPAPFMPATHDTTTSRVFSNDTNTAYSTNWAGAIHTAPPAGTTFTQVTGVFNVPTPQVPAGGNGDYAASAWVGIDGDTYGNAILQAGCDFTASSGGAPSYDCWYEWFPNPLTDFDGFTPSAGDSILVTVQSSSPTSGTAVLTNQRTGQTVTQILDAPSQDAKLAGQNAEWIVEDFSSNGGLVPFANFGQVTFSAASAQAGGQTVGTSGSTISEIQQNDKVLTSTTTPSDSSVQVTYQQ